MKEVKERNLTLGFEIWTDCVLMTGEAKFWGVEDLKRSRLFHEKFFQPFEEKICNVKTKKRNLLVGKLSQ